MQDPGTTVFKTTTFLSCERQERAFLCLQYENLVELLKVKRNKNVTEAPWNGLIGVYSSQTCPHWASGSLPITVWVFLPQYWSVEASASIEMWYSVSACPSSFRGSGSSCDHSSLMDLRRVVWQSRFLLVRTEWQLPNSYMGNQNTWLMFYDIKLIQNLG